MAEFIDVTGQKFGRLTVLTRSQNKGTRAFWDCICDCGNHKTVEGKKLRNGHTQSCGCYRKDKCYLNGFVEIHGQSRTKGYQRYHSRLREIAESRQTPKWADRNLIRQFYVNKPEGYHVDHIVPLRGKLVSGLHVESNLQYLPASENMRKHNTFNPENPFKNALAR